MNVLEKIDLSLTLDKSDYRKALQRAQVDLYSLTRQLYEQRTFLVIVFEGWDAAGKGGVIRRLTEKLDPRAYQVFAIAAPTDEEKAHQYLWRFWRRLPPPREKQVSIFDRSWYGRVLVERVEGFASEDAWRRAYREINDFERQLLDAGGQIAKFWLHISPEEQLRRFEQRQETAHKRWKLSKEDWRNRRARDAYEEAVDEMLVKTSTAQAPWTIVEANDKRYARVKVLETLVGLLANR